MFPEAKPSRALRVEGKHNSLFPEGPVIKCFVIPPNSKIEKMRKNDLYDGYGGCACSTSGSETKLCYRNDTITVFFFAVNKKIKTIIKFLCLLLRLNLKILGLI